MPKKKLTACGECKWLEPHPKDQFYDTCLEPDKFDTRTGQLMPWRNMSCSNVDFNKKGHCTHFTKKSTP